MDLHSSASDPRGSIQDKILNCDPAVEQTEDGKYEKIDHEVIDRFAQDNRAETGIYV